jgi:hypothetical protein
MTANRAASETGLCTVEMFKIIRTVAKNADHCARGDGHGIRSFM